MLKPYLTAGFITGLYILIASCAKTGDHPANFTVDNTWECTINGVQYKGSVDTSFAEYFSSRDTIISCTGTSLDKKANIYFWIQMNRRASRSSNISTAPGGALLAFDTISSNLYTASSGAAEEVIYTIDALSEGKLKASFSGTIIHHIVNGSQKLNITNGKFNCEFGKGNKEPKFFSFKNDNDFIQGYIKSASLVTNTLILDCLPFSPTAQLKFKLLIRTGGFIKPGIYRSEDGDVGLQYFVPSIYPLYITNDAGSLSVTIHSVSGDIVEGSFSGANIDGKQVSGGRFICRVKNYQPEADSINKWMFGFDDYYFLYTLYGGNMSTANRSQVADRYFLTLNGDSDQGESKFKIVLSSTSPISPGAYKSGFSPTRQVDTMYFRSNQKVWNGNTINLFPTYGDDMYCRIDSINSEKVVGQFFGKISIYTGSYTSTEIRKGSFRASF